LKWWLCFIKVVVVAIKVVEVIEHELEGIQLEVDILKFCKILKCCELLVDLSQCRFQFNSNN